MKNNKNYIDIKKQEKNYKKNNKITKTLTKIKMKTENTMKLIQNIYTKTFNSTSIILK